MQREQALQCARPLWIPSALHERRWAKPSRSNRMPYRLPRRRLLATTAAGAAALPLVAIRTRPANAAEFSYKYANNSPVTHPLTVRTTEAAARIKEKTGGR